MQSETPKPLALHLFKNYRSAQVRVNSWALRFLVRKIGRNVKAYGFPHLTYPERISIGDDVTINEGVTLGAHAPIQIGDRVRLSTGVILQTAYLEARAVPRRGHLKKPITIGADVWIASRAIILAGVTVGEGSVVAAGAIVTRDVPPMSLAVGIPAKAIPLFEAPPLPRHAGDQLQ